MKKLKEFVKKIGNKKRCLLSLLLAGLLIFAVVSGLNGSKSAVTEVNALSAPTTKNLDLNGVRYTYNTSLSELKNNYGLFQYEYTRKFLTLWETENLVTLELNAQVDKKIEVSQNDEYKQKVIDELNAIINDNIYYLDNENKKINSEASVENGYDETMNDGIIYNTYTLDNLDNLSTSTKLTINFINIFNALYSADVSGNEKNILVNKDLYQSSLIFTVVYSANESGDTTEKGLKETSIVYNYCLSKPLNYTFNIPKKAGYDIGLIYVSFANPSNVAKENAIFGIAPKIYWVESAQHTQESYLTIDKIKFIDDSNANIITFESDYTTSDMPNTYPYFSGNILLSTTNYDSAFISEILTPFLNVNPTVDLSGGAFLGGKFNDNKPISTLYFKVYTGGVGVGVSTVGVVDDINNLNSNNANYSVFDYVLGRPRYKNQNQLLYVEQLKTLRSSINSTEYSALSEQVQDVLYSVEYVGNIEEEEFKEKTQDDLIDLLKTTGVGAVIGLLIGFLVGNPIGGLVVGAVIGFAVAIIPLIIDGLQAIFGYDFLSGLYDFFNAITEFFVNVIDKIVGFLLSIITNPFVLVLIVLVAILYIFVIRPKIK